ncbi:MAG: 30S ribosomal protein S20 [Anaerolineae bacterium]|nr:30S ribosomal protein S20 [Anaerolineae bacterium]
MANTKSAIKNIRKSRRKQARNLAHRSRARTVVKKARLLITAGKKEEALQALREAHQVLDKTAAKGIIHRNNAARRKSRLARMFNQHFAGE